MKLFLSIALCVTFLFGCSISSKICKCVNVDDCLSKNCFGEAREYASKIGHGWGDFNDKDQYEDERIASMCKIIVFEVNYWILQNELKRAEFVTKEIPLMEPKYHPRMKDELNRKYIELNLEIIKRYCELGQIEDGKQLALKLPQKTCIGYKDIILDCQLDDSRPDEKKSKACLTIYNNYKKTLPKNEDIGPFQSSHNNYVVIIYSFAKDEALEILKNCK